MNYRHGFHAGNFADCFKHVLLVRLVRSLQRKPAPIFVLDTHAGAGCYDLGSDQARRTGEAAAGVRRLLADPPPALDDYLSLVRRTGTATAGEATPPLYPGSPALIRALLRPEDRAACCELHPEDVGALRRFLDRDPRVAVHHRDAWEAVRGLLPPAQKRGLVFIDPPFEAPDEFSRLAEAIMLAQARFPTGIVAAWYPIKHRAPVRAFHDALRHGGIRDVIVLELLLRDPLDASRLNGCGLVVVRPPFTFDSESYPLLEALLRRLGTREPGEGVSITRIADE